MPVCIGSCLVCTGCSGGLSGIPKVATCNCWPGGVFTTATHTFVQVAPCMGVRTEFRLPCTCCAKSFSQWEAFLRFASLVIHDNAVRHFSIAAVAMQTLHGSLYTFFIKPKWRTVVFCLFVAHSLVEAYVHTSPPQGQSTVGVPKRCGGFVVIWLRAHKEFVDNHFQLLFTYTLAESACLR